MLGVNFATSSASSSSAFASSVTGKKKTLTFEQVQTLLEENQDFLDACIEYQNLGRVYEALQYVNMSSRGLDLDVFRYQLKLHQNLMALGCLADENILRMRVKGPSVARGCKQPEEFPELPAESALLEEQAFPENEPSNEQRVSQDEEQVSEGNEHEDGSLDSDDSSSCSSLCEESEEAVSSSNVDEFNMPLL